MRGARPRGTRHRRGDCVRRPGSTSRRSILSRGVAGVAGRTLIVNLPGSPGAVRDGVAVLAPILRHAVEQLAGGDHERAVSRRCVVTLGWPVVLEHGPVTLRPLRMRDAPDWRMTRLVEPRVAANRGRRRRPVSRADDAGRGYGDAVRALRRDARLGLAFRSRCWSTTSSPVSSRSARSRAARRTRPISATGSRARSPVAASCRPRSRWSSTTASATPGLHRVEANIRPENVASRRVVEKLGFPARGHPRAIHPHRRRLARPPVVRADERGSARRATGPLAARRRRDDSAA